MPEYFPPRMKTDTARKQLQLKLTKIKQSKRAQMPVCNGWRRCTEDDTPERKMQNENLRIETYGRQKEFLRKSNGSHRERRNGNALQLQHADYQKDVSWRVYKTVGRVERNNGTPCSCVLWIE